MSDTIELRIVWNGGGAWMKVPRIENEVFKKIGQITAEVDMPNTVHVYTVLGDAELSVRKRGNARHTTLIFNNIKGLEKEKYYEKYLTNVSAEGNHYRFSHFQPTEDGFLNITYGRIGVEYGNLFGPRNLQKPLPSCMYWPHFFDLKENGYKPSTKSITNQIAEGKKWLSEMRNAESLCYFNACVENLMAVIPRQVTRVKSAETIKDVFDIMEREKALLEWREKELASGVKMSLYF